LKFLGRSVDSYDVINKVLSTLSPQWRIQERGIRVPKDLEVMTLGEVIGILVLRCLESERK